MRGAKPLLRLHDFMAWTQKILRFFQRHKTCETEVLKAVNIETVIFWNMTQWCW